MDDLANTLQDIGVRAKVRNGKVVVKLDGLSNPVSVVKDIAAGQYKVKTNDSVLAITACLLLFSGLISGYENISYNWISIALISVAMLSFLTVLLTELKASNLRAIVAEINRGKRV